MSGNSEFVDQVQEAINQKYSYLTTAVMSQIKENYRTLHSNINSVVLLCQKKGVLKSDPYRKEKQISEVTPPEDVPLPEAYSEDELSIRLSEYDARFDFLNNYVSFAPDVLTLKDLRAQLAMLRFIRWNDFSPHSTKPTTRALATVLERIQKGSDNFAAGAITSSIHQCAKIAAEINTQLKHITFTKREEYKVEVRSKIMTRLDLGTSIPRDLFIKEIKKQFPTAGIAQPFFAELVEEIYDEDFGENTQEARKKVFANLEVPQKTQAQSKKLGQNLNDILVEGLRNLGTASRHMELALIKLRENSELLANRPRGLMEKFKDWIIQLSSGKQTEVLYEIELVDPVTSAHTPKELNFSNFAAGVDKKARLLQGFYNKQSQTYRKIQIADQDQLYTLLDKNLVEVQEILWHLDALDTFFKAEVDRSQREQVKGIKIEITGVQNSLQSASQKKHEFIAKKDEQEQLKKLGINQ